MHVSAWSFSTIGGQIHVSMDALFCCLQICCGHGAGRGGQYFSPPYLSLLTVHLNNAGRFFPYHKSSRNEEHWKRLYDRTLDIVNGKLKEKNLPVISAV